MYFQRCFTAVDGLWFMKLEERLGFDAALDVDDAVWNVLPKIQARAVRSMLSAPKGALAMRCCFSAKLKAEGFAFSVDSDGDSSFSFCVTSCPWHETMIRSGRSELSGKVGARICSSEYSIWAREFSTEEERMELEFLERICKGAERCRIAFSILRDKSSKLSENDK
jgi:hypothetical protein